MNILQRLNSEAKLPKMADFVDATEVDKIRNAAEIFSCMAKIVFNWVMDSRYRYRFIVWKKQIKKQRETGKRRWAEKM